MSTTYAFEVEGLEFEIFFTTKEVPQNNSTIDTVLRFFNAEYCVVADHSLFSQPSTQKDLELMDNLKYALENGNVTLQLNDDQTSLVFKANFGTISGKPVIYCTYVKKFTKDLGKVILQKKYDDLLAKHNDLKAKHKELTDKYECVNSTTEIN